ncbi:hypothetical protein [Nocardia sp. NBC_01388]|uniref:hypothetical protein n=1 Tax=Nocardia sp. NBC_01388 TaxID=2903596 RepID=UPI00324D3626
MLTTSLVPGLIVTLAAFAYGALRLPLTEPRHAAPTRLRTTQDHPIDISLWPPGWPHEAPEQPLSLLEAHQAMQSHLTCTTKECGRKAAAFDVLTGAGVTRARSKR